MQNVLLRLREVHASLSSTEQQIAGFILDNPEATADLTVRELADRTFSSPSSVLRVCRAVGFLGYKDMRHALIQELAALGDRGSHPEEEVAPEDSVQDIINKVTHKNVQSLLDTQRLLDPEVVEDCVRLLSGARMIMLFGIGASLLAAKDAYLKFLRLDKPCVVNEDWHSQLLQAVNSTPQDVGIVFSYSGQTVEMIQCMKAMKENGTPVIAITRYYPSAVAKMADYALYIAANESLFRNGAMSSRLSQMNVTDVLYTLFAGKDREATMRLLTRTHILKPGEPLP